MDTLTSTDASTGFAASVLYKDPPADAASYLACVTSYLATCNPGFAPDTTPTAENLRQAKNLLLDQLLGDVSFALPSARANALAMTLQPLVRPLMSGPTPLYVVSGVRGSGKTTLVRTAISPYQRAEVFNAFRVRTEREWERMVGAGLLRRPTHFFIDGQATRLSSPSLCQALTSNNFSTRLYRRQSTTTLPVLCTWVFASEAPSISQDVTIRAVHIPLNGLNRMEPLYQIRKAQLSPSQLFAAALTLVRGWIAAGEPKFREKSHRYAEWSQVMGGILAVADVPGFLDDQE